MFGRSEHTQENRVKEAYKRTLEQTKRVQVTLEVLSLSHYICGQAEELTESDKKELTLAMVPVVNSCKRFIEKFEAMSK